MKQVIVGMVIGAALMLGALSIAQNTQSNKGSFVPFIPPLVEFLESELYRLANQGDSDLAPFVDTFCLVWQNPTMLEVLSP